MRRASEDRVTLKDWRRAKLGYLSHRNEGRRQVILHMFFNNIYLYYLRSRAFLLH
jgi:hypothetical protein